MTYSQKKIRGVNWGMARLSAYEVLRRHNVTDFPLDLVDLINSYGDIKLMSYSELAERQKISIDEIIQTTASIDGSITYHAKRDKYIIFYNDEIEKKERIYWTLAHEFGHYILKHHKESGRSSISRMEISDEEYDLFEKEADFFARFLINPPSIIKEWREIRYDRVMSFFGVSFSAANNTLNYLKRIARNGWSVVAPEDLKIQLKYFIDKVNVGRYCFECSSLFTIDNSNYCPICGTDKITNLLGDDDNLIYFGFEVDQNSKALKCPKCENEELLYDGSHCIQCGVYLINRCSHIDHDFDGNKFYVCGTKLPGNARYCFKCGEESTFFTQKLLDSWETEKKRREYESLPF